MIGARIIQNLSTKWYIRETKGHLRTGERVAAAALDLRECNMPTIRQPRVAVIGLGAQGLVTLKNLLEQGFDATGFEKNDYVGVVNISRERACFTDFPFPDGSGSYPNSAEVDKYLNDYADHFKLWPHIRLSTAVDSVKHNDDADTWNVSVRSQGSTDSETLLFDKLVMAVGPHSTPKIPELPGKGLFTGEIIHSIAFKDHLRFAGKRVVVVGASNTAADAVSSLAGIASKVYLSHRHGSLVLPRYLNNGKSLDHFVSYRQDALKNFLDVHFPRASQNFMDRMVHKVSVEQFGKLDPQWRLTPMPSIIHQLPTVSDTLVPYLRAGKITSIAAPARVTGPTTIELQDEATVEADAIIWCTGYGLDLSILGPNDPTLCADGTHDAVTPKLYQNIFSLRYPDSLAIIGTALVFFPAFVTSDLSSMAVAQLWSNKPGSPTLPPMALMEKWYKGHLVWVESVRRLSPLRKFVKLSVQSGPWLSWVQEVAGTNVEENLSWTSLQAWKFWISDRQLCGLLMDGICTPHMYRVFDSERRRKWDGARDAIVKVNADVRQAWEKRKAEMSQRKE